MNRIREISIDDAKKKFDEQRCVFVDVRDPASYHAAHIPGAVHLHDGNVREFVHDADKDRETIVYCYHGNSSLGAAAYFLQNGFTNVVSMSGGFEAWRQAYEHEAG